MRTTSKWALAIAAVLIVILLAAILLRPAPQSDQDQIATQLSKAASAARNHDASGIMQVISADFKGPSPISNTDSLHLMLIRGLRNSGRLQIDLSPPSVAVTGDTATSTSQVTVRSKESGETFYSGPLALSWRREDGHRLLVLPAKVWRIVGTTYQGPLLDDGS